MPRGPMGHRCSYGGGAGRGADEDKHLRNDDVRGPGLGRLVLSCIRARRQIDTFFFRLWGCSAADLSITVSKL